MCSWVMCTGVQLFQNYSSSSPSSLRISILRTLEINFFYIVSLMLGNSFEFSFYIIMRFEKIYSGSRFADVCSRSVVNYAIFHSRYDA